MKGPRTKPSLSTVSGPGIPPKYDVQSCSTFPLDVHPQSCDASPQVVSDFDTFTVGSKSWNGMKKRIHMGLVDLPTFTIMYH